MVYPDLKHIQEFILGFQAEIIPGSIKIEVHKDTIRFIMNVRFVLHVHKSPQGAQIRSRFPPLLVSGEEFICCEIWINYWSQMRVNLTFGKRWQSELGRI